MIVEFLGGLCKKIDSVMYVLHLILEGVYIGSEKVPVELTILYINFTAVNIWR